MRGEGLRGVHVFAGIAAFFGVMILIQVVFVIQAVRTFPGEEVEKSYVQGLDYNATLERRAAQKKLGWSAEAGAEDGTLIVRREGVQVIIQILERDSFASGRSEIDSSFVPTLARVGSALARFTVPVYR